MNTKKIAVLEKAIHMLENGFDYDWSETNRCNCGVVVAAQIGDFYAWEAGDGNWEGKTQIGECPITGLKLGRIQSALVENGFTKKDIIELEFLKNEDIKCKAGISDNSLYDNKETLLKYLRAWVSILKEQDEKEAPKQPEVKERIVYVSVPTTLISQAKELISIKEERA